MCHKSIEVLFDPDFYFQEYNYFSEKGANDLVTRQENSSDNGRIVDRIFDDYDVNRDGKLSKDESKVFIRQYLE